jgi:hypothetical protein
LLPSGKSKRVDYSNLEEYIDLSLKARLSECKSQVALIKKGIDITFKSNYLRVLHWKDL